MQMLITQHLVCHAVSFQKKKKSVARMFENCGEKKGKKRENCEAKPILLKGCRHVRLLLIAALWAFDGNHVSKGN